MKTAHSGFAGKRKIETTHRSGLQAGPTVTRPTYNLIQVLRAVAAVMVVMHHATQAMHDRYHLRVAEWPNGASGVDIFFVISGFVMTISSQPLIQSAHPARTFLARRLERIVPLYWLLTSVKLLLVMLHPSYSLNGLGDAWHIVSSFLFFPYVIHGHLAEPLLIVGWTLNLEIVFYLIFAGALAMRSQPAKVVTPVLVLLALSSVPLIASGPHLPDWLSFYRDPIVLEFAFGVILATVLRLAARVPWIVALVIALSGFCCLFLLSWPRASMWRFVAWGAPALAIVTAAVALESRWGKHVPKLFLELGDSSYSLYLVHGFTLPILGGSLTFWLARQSGGLLLVFLSLVLLSIASGELLYRSVELPMMLWFRGRRRPAVPANV